MSCSVSCTGVLTREPLDPTVACGIATELAADGFFECDGRLSVPLGFDGWTGDTVALVLALERRVLDGTTEPEATRERAVDTAGRVEVGVDAAEPDTVRVRNV